MSSRVSKTNLQLHKGRISTEQQSSESSLRKTNGKIKPNFSRLGVIDKMLKVPDHNFEKYIKPASIKRNKPRLKESLQLETTLRPHEQQLKNTNAL